MQPGDFWAALLIAIISGGLLQYGFSVIVNRRKLSVDIDKTKAETKSTEVMTALNLAKSLSSRIDDLENDLKIEKHTREELNLRLDSAQDEQRKLQEKVDYLLNGIQVLAKQIEDLGYVPAFKPPKSEFELNKCATKYISDTE